MVPKKSDDIEIKLIQTKGIDGNVGANLLTNIVSNEFIKNITTDQWIPKDNITTVTNPRSGMGGAAFENIESLRTNALAFSHSQFRCTTAKDYKNFMERKPEIAKAAAWGQQELLYQSDVRDYNKAWLTFIPVS
jgi:hypothetical protein